MQEKTVSIPSISCGHCVMRVQNAISELDGVSSVKADAESQSATIKWAAPAKWDSIAAKLAEIGYPAS